MVEDNRQAYSAEELAELLEPAPPPQMPVLLSAVAANGFRLDARAYSLSGMAAKEKIKSSSFPVAPLAGPGGLARAWHCKRFKRIYLEEPGIPFFLPSQIEEAHPLPLKYISPATHTDLSNLIVRKGQLLLSCSGTIGKTGYVGETLNNKLFSHDLIRLEGNDEYDAGYLYAFLKTETGQLILKTGNYGAVIQHIEPEYLESVPVPNAPKELKRAIAELVYASYEKRDEANVLMDEARARLLAALGLPAFNEFSAAVREKNETIGFGTLLSRFRLRLDASFHHPLVERTLELLRKNGIRMSRVGDPEISERIILPGRFKRAYVEKSRGVPFIGGKQLLELIPNTDKFLSRSIHAKILREELFFKENMILISCSGTIGKIQIVPRHWENYAGSQHILRIIASRYTAGYIYAWLSSDYGQACIVRHTYGSVVDEIDDNHLSQVELPVLADKLLADEINEQILQANTLRYEAFLDEQKALDRMNEEVLN